MTFGFTPEQEALREALGRVVRRFGEAYWLEQDRTAAFPNRVHRGRLARDARARQSRTASKSEGLADLRTGRPHMAGKLS